MNPSSTLTLYRLAVKSLIDAMNTARDLELVIASQGGADIMFADTDFTGSDIDKAQLVAAIGSRQAIEELVTANGNAHLTNLNRMLP